jgi:hypothetical protein
MDAAVARRVLHPRGGMLNRSRLRYVTELTLTMEGFFWIVGGAAVGVW